MKMVRTVIIASAVLVLVAGAAQAQTVVPLAGIQTFDGPGDPSNTVLNVGVAPDLFINEVSWTAVTGGTIGFSWASEARVLVSNTAQTNTLTIQMFTTSGTNPAAGPVSGTMNVTSNPTLFPLALDPDNNIRIEFWEAFVDSTDLPSFGFTGGDLTFSTAVPVELMTFTVN